MPCSSATARDHDRFPVQRSLWTSSPAWSTGPGLHRWRPNALWAADFTYVPTWSGTAYVAVRDRRVLPPDRGLEGRRRPVRQPAAAQQNRAFAWRSIQAQGNCTRGCIRGSEGRTSSTPSNHDGDVTSAVFPDGAKDLPCRVMRAAEPA